MEYKITWKIEVDAENFEEAVLLALSIQRDPNSIATHFHVRNQIGEKREVDLLDHSPAKKIEIQPPK